MCELEGRKSQLKITSVDVDDVVEELTLHFKAGNGITLAGSDEELADQVSQEPFVVSRSEQKERDNNQDESEQVRK